MNYTVKTSEEYERTGSKDPVHRIDEVWGLPYWSCPTCEEPVFICDNYCAKCGQRLGEYFEDTKSK